MACLSLYAPRPLLMPMRNAPAPLRPAPTHLQPLPRKPGLRGEKYRACDSILPAEQNMEPVTLLFVSGVWVRAFRFRPDRWAPSHRRRSNGSRGASPVWRFDGTEPLLPPHTSGTAGRLEPKQNTRKHEVKGSEGADRDLVSGGIMGLDGLVWFGFEAAGCAWASWRLRWETWLQGHARPREGGYLLMREGAGRRF